MTRQEEKQWLRQTVRRLEANLSDAYRRNSDRAIAAHLLAMPEYQAAGTVFCFVGTSREIDTRPILEAVLAAGKALCVPLCTAPGQMELRRITALEQLSPGTYGILEPPTDAPRVSVDEVDMAILPCLTCNHLGQRLGQGGGYYDRLLSSGHAYRCGFCFSLQLRDAVPCEEHDCSVDCIVTESELI